MNRKYITQIIHIVLLIISISIIFLWVHKRISIDSFRIPIAYSGDALFDYGNAKAYMDGDIYPIFQKFVAHLNAPFEANWNDWPLTEEVLFAFIGYLGKLIGLFAAGNFTLLLAHILAGLSFWFVGSRMGCRREYLFLFSLSYALSPFIFWRGFSHLVLANYWHLPWLLLISWWAFKNKKIDYGHSNGKLAILFSFIAGILNPYYMWIYLQFLGFATLSQVLNKRYKNVVSIAVLILVTVFGFLLFNLDTISYNFQNGSNSQAVSRSLAGLEIYGLKLPELFFPSIHRLGFFQSFSQRHYFDSIFVRGELGSPYLGLLGIISLCTLFIFSFKEILTSQANKLSVIFWQVNWVILYSLIGGINLIIGIFGLVLFRGTNRYSIVILTLVLLYLASFLSKNYRKIQYKFSVIILIPFFLWDQLPIRVKNEDLLVAQEKFMADKNFAFQLEAALPDQAKVFQLPIMKFPENPQIQAMGEYEHFRPYLFTRELRYSYGGTKGRGYDDWQENISSKEPIDMAHELEKMGFSAIFINKKGYVNEKNKLVGALNSLGYEIISENSDLVAFRINPNPKPTLPNVIYFEKGWSIQESGHRWSTANKSNIKIIHESNLRPAVSIQFKLDSFFEQNIEVYLNGKNINNFFLNSGVKKLIVLDITLKGGENIMTIKSDAMPRSPQNGDLRLLTFNISDFNIK